MLPNGQTNAKKTIPRNEESSMRRKNIRVRVKNLVCKVESANPIEIASTLNIPIEYAPLPQNILGYLTKPIRRKVIIINDKLGQLPPLIEVAACKSELRR